VPRFSLLQSLEQVLIVTRTDDTKPLERSLHVL
jgi:hypothetical protein